MSKVIIEKATYDYRVLKPVIFEIMDNLVGERIRDCKRILIKPNLLTVAEPDEAVVTHFTVLKAVAEYVLEKGSLPQISDSPALGSFDKILKESGIRDALYGLAVEFSEFKESIPVDVGRPFGVMELARDAVEADMIINLPKLKTHTQMLLTLGVKNMFGCVVGLRKPEWHMKMSVNRDMFARLLAQIYEKLKPSVTILDGILAMEGEGPNKRGIPRRLDVIIAGSNAFAVDAAVCRMLKLDEDAVPILRAAKEIGVKEEPEIQGTLPEIRDFRLPDPAPLSFGPAIIQGFVRKRLLQRPVCDPNLCQLCGKCWEFCPTRAVSRDLESLSFNYERCIRCYCCIEVCPYGALHTFESIPGKLLRRFIR
jgi:uncharacterized protein (DUF362 family)/Pyruvate/2-oxoacid:ferredoxin oxidoreductase delta subunit